MNSEDPDWQLLARFGRGERAAARLLMAAKLPRVVSLANRLLADTLEAEDVAQEAFVRLLRHAPDRGQGPARFDTWLHTIVLNLCRDRMRRRWPETGVELPDLVDPAPSAEAELIERDKARAVAQAIAALPERQREAIILVHYQDCSGQEAADSLGVSVEALESLLARGRRTLRARFAGGSRDA